MSHPNITEQQLTDALDSAELIEDDYKHYDAMMNIMWYMMEQEKHDAEKVN
jgi:hypothetical protein